MIHYFQHTVPQYFLYIDYTIITVPILAQMVLILQCMTSEQPLDSLLSSIPTSESASSCFWVTQRWDFLSAMDAEVMLIISQKNKNTLTQVTVSPCLVMWGRRRAISTQRGRSNLWLFPLQEHCTCSDQRYMGILVVVGRQWFLLCILLLVHSVIMLLQILRKTLAVKDIYFQHLCNQNFSLLLNCLVRKGRLSYRDMIIIWYWSHS